MSEEDVRVLTIQSHVVYGTVGNRSVVFPMQLLGFDVDIINSVQFSNHTWYETVRGQVLNAKELQQLYEGLTMNRLDGYSYIMTGYIGDASFLEEVRRLVEDQKAKHPGLLYVCDPVMGDEGKMGQKIMYVPEALLPIYREKILPIADIVLPNQFEAESLTGKKIENEEDAIEVIRLLHAAGVSTVVLSSTDLGNSDNLVGYASRRFPDGTMQRVRMLIPRVGTDFVGTGDLFSALFVSWFHVHQNDLKLVCQKVIGTMQAVLWKTYKRAIAKLPPDTRPCRRDVELPLVKCKKEIENPTLHDGVEIMK